MVEGQRFDTKYLDLYYHLSTLAFESIDSIREIHPCNFGGAERRQTSLFMLIIPYIADRELVSDCKCPCFSQSAWHLQNGFCMPQAIVPIV
jgi:hypothetical protein